jgi:hypothetical protein
MHVRAPHYLYVYAREEDFVAGGRGVLRESGMWVWSRACSAVHGEASWNLKYAFLVATVKGLDALAECGLGP